MKKLFIALIILTIATPALARHKCTPYMKKYWRNALGTNVVLVDWRCKGSGNGYHVNTSQICGRTGNGTVTCADNYQDLSITGQSIKLRFDSSVYPIKKLFIKK